MSKKILLISPHFYPEDFKCNDVAFELANRGYNVTVLSDIPNYPKGRFYKGYGVFRKRRENINGVKIIRTLMIPRGNGSGKMLALNYISFALTASVRAFFMGLFNRYDAVLVHETSPVTVGIPAVIVKKIRPESRLIFWVLDLWPESLQVAGGINNKKVLNFFDSITKWIYRNSDHILMSSRGFEKSICSKGDFASKLIYFPNWAEDSLGACSDYKLPDSIGNIKSAGGFILMFAGNIGEAQDFDHVLDAANILKNENIHFVLLGDGRKRVWVEEYVAEHNLENTVHLLGRHPLETMGKFFQRADAMFFALKDSLIFNLTVPAKLQAYMSEGKPVVAMLNGEGASIISDAGCGFAVPSGDSKSFAEVILGLSRMKADELEQMGLQGKRYCQEHFSFEKNMELLTNLM